MTCKKVLECLQPVHCIVWAKELPFAKLFGEAGLANDLDLKSDDQAEEASEEDRNWHRMKESETTTEYARRVRLAKGSLNVTLLTWQLLRFAVRPEATIRTVGHTLTTVT